MMLFFERIVEIRIIIIISFTLVTAVVNLFDRNSFPFDSLKFFLVQDNLFDRNSFPFDSLKFFSFKSSNHFVKIKIVLKEVDRFRGDREREGTD